MQPVIVDTSDKPLLFLGLAGSTLFVVVYNACCGWYIGTIRSW